ncbi:MAG: efflux RND transporter periplasmic adaptor subunit, partial [Bacteroidota bacterium]|nr:efflux RND transporter periplasmic adaptor subunit [Bacteroidota bacterium]MDX5431441.1 efflux RND transporter periplasmic adaptor subunit [Bacteroidota bacterium]MDX5470169.1 efflux RND transporter periplasmic adaptor subunit [Bacteroidota bacterium]
NPFIHTVDIQGIITTDNNITLAAENGGKVMQVYVKEGQTVSKGQRLLDLDGSIIEANLAEVRTRLELAKTTYDRQKRLFDKQIGTEIQLLQAKNNYEALKKQEATLATQLDKFQLKSPIDGVVDAVMVNLGEVTAPGVPVVRVVNLKDLEVAADVSEKYVGAFKKGDAVQVYFPALKDTIAAKIQAVGQVINTNNRTFTLHVSIPSNDSRLKPNLLAIIQAADFSSNEAIAVPSNLVQTEGYDKFILVAVKSDTTYTAEKRSVRTGLTSKGLIMIEEGLTPGDLIISEGHLSVEPGDIVQPQ